MNMPGGNLQLSQGYNVLAPKSGKAYPVPCNEWCFLKDKLNGVSPQPWILPAMSFLFFGVSLTTFISIFIGAVSPGTSGSGVIVAWAVFIASGIVGFCCIGLSIKQYKIQRSQVSEVVRQMELIEQRFEQNDA